MKFIQSFAYFFKDKEYFKIAIILWYLDCTNKWKQGQ